MLHQWLLIFTILLLLPCTVSESCTDDLECKILELFPAMWKYEGETVPRIVLECSVDTPVCHVDIYSLLMTHTNLNTSANAFTSVGLHFHCSDNVQIFDFSQTSVTDERLIVIARLKNCKATWEAVSHIGDVYHLIAVEIIQESKSMVIREKRNNTLTGLSKLAFLELTLQNVTGTGYNIEDLLPYGNLTMESVANFRVICVENEIYNSYCLHGKISFYKSQLVFLFPHLQTLSLSGIYPLDNDVTIPFPWDPMPLDMLFNLTHSDFKQILFTRAYQELVDSSKFSRTLSVAGHLGMNVSQVCYWGLRLDTIVLIGNNITEIPENCFLSNNSTLFFLDLTRNSLGKLKSHTFNGLASLEVLHMARCGITELQDNVFDSLVKVRILNLDHNMITTIQKGLFSKMVSLESLFIHDNRIKTIDHHSLPTYSRHLTFVDFQRNELETLPYDCLTLWNLHRCDCAHNNISVNLTHLTESFDPVRTNFVQPGAYYGGTYIAVDVGIMHESDQSVISLKSNKIRRIEFNDLWSLDMKKRLAALLSFFSFDMDAEDSNSGFSCDCSLYQLKQFIITEEAKNLIDHSTYGHTLPLTNLGFLTWKCLVNSVLRVPTNELFRPFLNTSDDYFICRNDSLPFCPTNCTCYSFASDSGIAVDCDRTGYTKLPQNIPVPSDGGALIVNLAHNRINMETFEGCNAKGYEWLEHVTKLNLEHNIIQPSNVDHTTNFLNCVSRVTHLYLANNAISNLPLYITRKNYTELSLVGNKLVCTCNNKWLKKWLLRSYWMIPDYRTISCVNKSMPIVDLDIAEFTCEDMPYKVLVGCLTAFVVALIIVSISCYVYRYEVKIILFEKFNWHPFDKQDVEKDKEYDVYLMHCRDDKLWVVRTLLEGLEQMGYKTFIADRDFAVGASTAAEMATAFTKARRVIVAISQSFIDNDDAMGDFYHAYHHEHEGTSAGKRFLIMVKLRDKIDFGRHEVFKQYISTNYFVPTHAKRFWAQLRYWLPSLKRKNLPAGTDNIDRDDPPPRIV